MPESDTTHPSDYSDQSHSEATGISLTVVVTSLTETPGLV
jgi:hypothetical protein